MPTATPTKRRRRRKKRKSSSAPTRAVSRNLTPSENARPRFRLVLQVYDLPDKTVGKPGAYRPVAGQSVRFSVADLDVAKGLFTGILTHLETALQKA